MLCGRTAIRPQRAEDYEADQVRIRARAVVSALSLRYIKHAQRPVPIEEVAGAIEVPIGEVTEAVDAAVARHLLTSRASLDGSLAFLWASSQADDPEPCSLGRKSAARGGSSSVGP
jgi:hypothetical protein